MIKRIVLTIFAIMLAFSVKASNDALLNQLDSLMGNVEQLYAQKQMKIDMLKKSCASHFNEKESLLDLYHQIYEEYYVFQFDSAMTYVDKEITLAASIANHYHYDLGRLEKAELLSIGGLYSEALHTINEIDKNSIDPRLLFKYNLVFFHVYQLWSAYCNDQTYAPKYKEIANAHLRDAVSLLSEDNPSYNYYMGEYYIYIERNDKKALEYYFKVLRHQPVASREYAMASFAIANNYSANNDMEKYEEYLIKACISDLMNCTRESLALQDLAMYLYKRSHQNIYRAEKYINFAMEDAKEFNNRLRMIEISHKLPVIVATYREMVTSQNQYLRIGLFSISILSLLLIVLLYFFFRQNKQLAFHKHQLAHKNDLLTTLNGKLHHLNEKLLNTNTHRERLAKLYIDLCAKYIDRLSKFELLVCRKIKANQVHDLLSMTSSSKLSEEDAATFMRQFDRAFIDLYPTFIEEFNALLKDDEKVIIKQDGYMTTELRIFALVRLGVKESAEIAALLFYTPRTIYNYRSAFKNKAKNRDTFEDDVVKLCTVI